MTTAAPVSEIIVPITCHLCKLKFTPPAGVDLSDTPDRRAAKFVTKLSAHIRERHPQQFQAAALQGQEYGGMLMLRFFAINGNEIVQQLDQTRWKIHQATRAVIVSDERITRRAVELFSPTHTEDEIKRAFAAGGLGLKIVDLLKEMRDTITEAARY